MENFGKFCYTVILLIATTLISGFVFNQLWDWFIVASFDIPSISLAQAIGLVLFVGYLKPKLKKDDEKYSVERFTKSFGETVTMSLVVLGIGWIITQFM